MLLYTFVSAALVGIKVHQGILFLLLLDKLL